MGVYDDYVLQTFYDKNGKPETAKPRQCRICWIQNDFPPFTELEKICNSTYKTIRKYSSIYNWDAIREKAIDLKAQQDQEELKKKQSETLTKLDKTNDKRLDALDRQLDSLLKQLENPSLTDKELYLIRKEIREVVKEYHSVQNDKLRTVNLPEKINDRQDFKHTGEVGMNVRLKKLLDPDNIKNAGKK